MKKYEIQKLVTKAFTDKSLKQESLLYFKSVMSHQTIEKQEVVLDEIRFHCKSIIENEVEINEEDLFVISEQIDKFKDKTNEVFDLNKHIRHCYLDFCIINNSHPDEQQKTLPLWVIILLCISVIGICIWLFKRKNHTKELMRLKDTRLINISENIQEHINKIKEDTIVLKNFGISQEIIDSYFKKEIQEMNIELNQRKINEIKIELQ